MAVGAVGGGEQSLLRLARSVRDASPLAAFEGRMIARDGRLELRVLPQHRPVAAREALS